MDDVIWRLETKDGFGFYRSAAHGDNYMAALADSDFTPLPYSDGMPEAKLYPDSAYIFGFKSLEQARDWFPGAAYLRAWGEDQGGCLVAYPRSLAADIVFGRHQVAFVPPPNRLETRVTRPAGDLWFNPELETLIISELPNVIAQSRPNSPHGRGRASSYPIGSFGSFGD